MSGLLIDCPACGNKVSSQAGTCPRCGQPIRPMPRPAAKTPSAPPASLSGRTAWSPWTGKADGPAAAVTFSNIRLTPEAILQKVRYAFERDGFSVKQSEFRDGTAATIGGFTAGEGGGLVGGLTAINKKTWNPFLVSGTGNTLIQAEVAVLNVRQRMQAQDANSSVMTQDIELQIRIKKSTAFHFTVGMLAAVLGIIFALATTDDFVTADKERMTLFSLVFAGIGYFPCQKIITRLFWTSANANGLKKAVDRVIDNLSDQLQ